MRKIGKTMWIITKLYMTLLVLEWAFIGIGDYLAIVIKKIRRGEDVWYGFKIHVGMFDRALRWWKTWIKEYLF